MDQSAVAGGAGGAGAAVAAGQERVEGWRLEVQGLAALWRREFLVFTREKSRVVSSIFTPLLWLFLFGTGLGTIANPEGYAYRDYIFPGIVAMTVLFSTVFYGVYIVWDRKLDVLKEVLVSPVNRVSIFFGKVLGGSTEALIQAGILLVLGVFIAPVTPLEVVPALAVCLLTAVGLVSLGLFIGSFFESLEGFQVIVTFLVFPMFFLSGALFPVTDLPGWLAVLTTVDPLTYTVDALRAILLGVSANPLPLNLAVLAGFDAVMVALGTWSFQRMR